MGFLTKFEGRMEDTVEGAADRLAKTPLSPVQIAKKAEKQMRREKMVGAGKQYAPTLYTVLVSPEDDERLFAYYPTLAGETETYLAAKAVEAGYMMDGQPLVRFIVDDGLRHGKFDVVAEMVASPLVAQLRDEEMRRYGINTPPANAYRGAQGSQAAPQPYQPQGFAQQPYQQSYQQPYQQPYQPPYQQPYQGQPYQEPDPLAYEPDMSDMSDMPEPDFSLFDSQDSEPFFDEQSYAPGVYEDAGNDPFASIPSFQQQASLYDLSTGRTYELGTGRTLLGRESSNDIVISDINVSRFHAEINQQGGSWVISDAGSMNGTYVNGIQIKSQALRPGDRIKLGTSEFTFHIS